jgi:NAD(P)-dependent dehydrogenase (short-subunit alcohol dehydrogenase family)
MARVVRLKLERGHAVEMLLESKTAVINGAGGVIGGTVAHAFARQGAKVFLAGHTLYALELDKQCRPAFQDTTKRNGNVFSTKT